MTILPDGGDCRARHRIFSILGAAAAPRRAPWAAQSGSMTYVELIRNTPFLVQLFFIFFGLPSLGLRLDATAAAMLAMTINLYGLGDRDRAAQGSRLFRRAARSRPGAGPAPAIGVRQDRASAGLANDLSGPDEPDHHHDAGIGGGLADCGARTDLRGRYSCNRATSAPSRPIWWSRPSISARASSCGGSWRGAGADARQGGFADGASRCGISCATFCSPRAGRCCFRSSHSSAAGLAGWAALARARVSVKRARCDESPNSISRLFQGTPLLMQLFLVFFGLPLARRRICALARRGRWL